MAEHPEGIKLLLVDDEVGYLEVLSKRLTRRGFKVTTASSGAEAIRALRAWDFDVAVVDLKMEDMTASRCSRCSRGWSPPST